MLEDQGAGADQRSFADPRSRQDDRAHPDQAPVADATAMHDRAVPDRHFSANNRRKARLTVQHYAILNVRSAPDLDPVDVAPGYDSEPEARILIDYDVAGKHNVRGEPA